MVVNYGLDSVRFIQPVKVNSQVRLKVDLAEVTEKDPGSGCSRRLPRWKSRVKRSLLILLSRFRSALSDAPRPCGDSMVPGKGSGHLQRLEIERRARRNRELRSLHVCFGPVTPVTGARGRLVCTARY